jgi:small subunit ribosomal protein S4
MIRRQHKRYTAPRNLFDKSRIDEENLLVKKYGLKNKREIWKADFFVNKLRNNAKKLITAGSESQQIFLSRVAEKGLVKKNAQIDDVLALTKEAVLERRLQTIVFKKKLARTAKEARQLIVHRHVKIKGNFVTIPSYFVNLNDEEAVSVERKAKPLKQEEKTA